MLTSDRRRKLRILENARERLGRVNWIKPMQSHSAMQTEFTHPHVFKKAAVKKGKKRRAR